MKQVREMLQVALKRARYEYTQATTEHDRAEWQKLIKLCLEELNATHGRIIS